MRYRIFSMIESLEETLEIIQDEELMAAFRESVEELAQGNRGESLDDVLEELGWE